jgi:putative ABC transport system ATP-binding protein
MVGSLRRLALGFMLIIAAVGMLLLSDLGSRASMHRGRVLHDIRGEEKKRLRPEDLLNRFEEVRRREQLDEPAAAMLNELYI